MRVTKRALATAILTAAGLGLGCGGGGGGGKFTTSVPGNTPLGGLTPAQVDQICRDVQSFESQPSVEMDQCRASAYATAALGASLAPTATDADLQEACATAYDACLHPDGGPTGGATCSAPPATCAATVAELTACLNDQAAANREAATTRPACNAVTRAGLEGSSGIGTIGSLPPSCQTYVTKCSGGGDDGAQAFATEYCALVDPCCAAAGLGSQCTGTLAGAALSLQFDAAAATACLDALHARQAGADFCGGLATVHPSWNNDSAVLPECAGVFKPYGGVVGSVGLGDACSDDTDCEAGPTGRSACVFDIFRAGASGGLNEICVGISGTPGDGPCIGTAGVMSGFSGVADPPAAGVFCDRGQGLICSDTTHLCVAAPGLGDPCTGSIECEGAATYCDFNIAACATRHAAGQPCNDAFGVCVDGTYCNRTTSQCTAQGGQGAACSTTFQLPSDCKAGYCGSDGICPSPLTPLCF